MSRGGRLTGSTIMGAAVLESGGIRQLDHEQWENFEKRLFYLVADPSDADCYRQLRAKLKEMHQAGSSTDHLFYVSTPASVVVPIIESLGSADLNRDHQGWSRIVLEKPFGCDLESAQRLNVRSGSRVYATRSCKGDRKTLRQRAFSMCWLAISRQSEQAL